jgi:arylsulfatase A-like enzyme
MEGPFPHSKTRLNDQGVKTPFIIHYPNIRELKGKESNSLISSIDIAPTIIDLANLEPIKSFQGSSFKNVLLNPESKVQKLCFC